MGHVLFTKFTAVNITDVRWAYIELIIIKSNRIE